MSRQIIQLGVTSNDGEGDPLRLGGSKINQNFVETYSNLGDGTTLPVASAFVQTTWSAGTAVAFRTAIGAGTGTGSVVSVAMTVPSFLSVSGSPITDSGTFVVTLAAQSANFVFAGPSSGASASPSFRTMVSNDLPANLTGYTGSGGTFSGPTILNPTISGGTISGATISGATISGQTFINPTVSGGTFSNVSIIASTFSGGTISGSTASAITVIASTFSGGTVSGATISGGIVRASTISGGTASGLTLTAPVFSGTTSGVVVATSAGTLIARTITGSGSITVANGDGVAGNPVISFSGSAGGGLTGFRNKIMNGCMRLAQRGTTFTGIGSAAYSLDRWRFGVVGAAVGDITQSTDVPATGGYINSLRYTVTTADASLAAGDFVAISTRVEGNNLADLLLGTASAVGIAISFWVRSSVTGSQSVSIQNGAENRSYIASFTINVANTWEQKTLSLTGDTSGTWLTTTGIGLILTFPLAMGSTYTTTAGTWQAGAFYGVTGGVNNVGTIGNIFAITGVQLEAASAATEFERRPLGFELALCQRYYCKTFPYATAPAQSASQLGAIQAVASGTGVAPNAGLAVSWRFPVEMRGAPTITTYTPTIANSGWYDTPSGTNLTVLTSATSSACRFLNNAAATNATLYQIHAAADIEL